MKAGWSLRPLGEVCTLQRGFDLPTRDRVAGGYPLVSSSGIIDTHAAGPVIGPGVVTGRSGSIGNVFFIENNFWPLNTVLYVKDFQGNTPKFVYHLLHQLDLKQFAGGTGVPTLNRNDVHVVKVLVPESSTEQQRIVAILDEAFDGIATAKANAEKNLQNARALFESHLHALFATGGEEWQQKSFDQVVDAKCTLSYGIVQPGEEVAGGLPIVRPTDLTTKVIRLSGLKRIHPKLADGYRRTLLRGGELLLCVRGSTGVVSVASAELSGGNVTRGIVPINFADALLTQEFGYYLLSSGAFQDQIREKTYGAALMQINIRDLRNIKVAFPKLEEQRRISVRLDALAVKTQRLQSLYQQKLAALDELKKSLLHEAFSGEL